MIWKVVLELVAAGLVAAGGGLTFAAAVLDYRRRKQS